MSSSKLSNISLALNILSCTNGPFERFRNPRGEEGTGKALRTLTAVSSLRRNGSKLYSKPCCFLPQLKHFVQSFNSLCAAPTTCDFSSFQDSAQNLENRDVMNGEQTGLLMLHKTKNELRYFFIKIGCSFLFKFGSFY